MVGSSRRFGDADLKVAEDVGIIAGYDYGEGK
jgi:hypothetical protein